MIFVDCAQNEVGAPFVLDVFGGGVVEVFEDDEDADAGDASAGPREAVDFVDGHFCLSLAVCSCGAIDALLWREALSAELELRCDACRSKRVMVQCGDTVQRRLD